MVDESISLDISEKRRGIIDALSKDELRLDIEQGGSARQLTAYMKLRLAKLEDDEIAVAREEDLSLVKAANTISAKAYRLSKWAILIAVLSLIASFLATV